MAITVEARTEIISLVVGMFGAAPGASVLSDLVAAYEANPSISDLAANLANTAEYKSIYPTFLTNGEYATKVVDNLLGEASTEAKAEAVTVLTAELNGGMTRSAAMVAAINFVANSAADVAAYATSATAFDNQVDVAVYYSVDKQLSGSTLAGLQNVIANVTSTAATVTTAKSSIDGTFNTGSTFSFTTGVDTFTGGANNDVFNGADTTLSAADTITGGAGTDTINYTNSTAAAAFPAASISGVEVLNVRAVGFALNATDLSLINGLTTFNSDRSNSSVTVTNLASGGSFGIIGDGSVTNTGTYAFGSAAAATAQTLNISGGTKGASTVTLTGAAVTATTINSTGADNTIGALTLAASSNGLTINATTKLTTGAVTAAGIAAAGESVILSGTGAITTDLNAVAAPKLTISNGGAVSTGTLNNATVTVDGSTATGAITTTLGTSTTMKFTGGAGNDLVTAGAVLATGAAVDAGAGTDRITFTANGQLTAVSGAKYTNFEVLAATTGVTDLDGDNIAGITALRTSGSVTAVDLNSTTAGAVTVLSSGNLNLGIKGAATVGQLDTLALTTSSTNTAVAIGTLASADTETISLTANTGTGLTSITTLAHDDWQFLNLAGASAITITTTATAAVINTKVDGSAATGVLTLDFGLTTTNGVQIIGGSAADVLTGTAQADSITGGAGADTITGGNGADSLTGGDGADKFVSVAAATATDGNGAGIDVITDFNTGGADILRIAAANNVAGSGGTAVATASVLVSAGGKATFATADDTLTEMITTLVADAAITANEVVFFELGSDTYVYGAGATADGSDDFMIKLTGVTGLTTLTESTSTAGDFTLA